MGRLATLPIYLVLGIGALTLVLIGLLPGARDEITTAALGLLRVGAITLLALGVLTPWARGLGAGASGRRHERSLAAVALLLFAACLAALPLLSGAAAVFLLAPLMSLALVGAARGDLVDPLAAIGAFSAAVWPLLLALDATPLVGLLFLARIAWALGGVWRAAQR